MADGFLRRELNVPGWISIRRGCWFMRIWPPVRKTNLKAIIKLRSSAQGEIIQAGKTHPKHAIYYLP